MSIENPSKLENWRKKYGTSVIAVSCLCSLITSWGNNWILTCFLGLGVLICGTIGISDITSRNKKI
ncbi:hypothetical protein M3589_16935 [Heyndrickxia oleronia]|uniref:hypothetical protein n=1 Tax=Heyndrickxia oleronia TaxID=38875 RepID=UPI00203CB1B2|nr:hypothetical protein [Heyndrickxia oleronia]MCM3239388.1 hypothetical protein [Heyndrickxia oleronia]